MEVNQVQATIKDHLDQLSKIICDQNNAIYITGMEDVKFDDDIEIMEFTDKQTRFIWKIPYSIIQFAIWKNPDGTSHEIMNNW